MTVTADEKKRVVIPGANPGDKFELSSPSPEQVILTRLVDRNPKMSPFAASFGFRVSGFFRPSGFGLRI